MDQARFDQCRDEALEELRRLNEQYGEEDPETLHRHVDNVICKLLAQLGLKEVVVEYQMVEKWFG